MYLTNAILLKIKRKMNHYETFSVLCNRYQIYSKANGIRLIERTALCLWLVTT